MKSFVLFDLDGTVIDSSECIFWVYERLFEKYRFTLPDREGMRRFIGPPIETTIGEYVEKDRIKQIADDFREIYKTVDLKQTNRLYDGIKEGIKRIKDGGKKVYIATSKNEPTAVKILRYLGVEDLFDGIYGSRYDLGEKNRMNKVDILKNLLAEIGRSPEEGILVGDTVFDVDGAEAVGMEVAIVNYGFGKREDFLGRKIAFFAKTPADLAEKLEEYCG